MIISNLSQYKNYKFDIIVVAGQSNAEGNGKSLDKKPIIVDEAFECVDCNPYSISINKDGTYMGLKLVMPVQTKIQKLQERASDGVYYSDFSITFAQDYLQSNLRKADRHLIIVKTAFGGTGFALNQQGVGNILFDRTIQMVKQVLDLNCDNKIIGYLWHQGEHDAFENKKLSNCERYNYYFAHFKEQTNLFRKTFKTFNIPVIAGGFCDSWKKDFLEECNSVENATKDVLKEIGNGAFISSEGLRSNDDDLHNGDTIHFSKSSLKILGNKYFHEFYKITANLR